MIKGIIYKTINSINGKIYIGKTESKPNGYLGSGKYILRAIKKYGKENFTRIIIDMDNNRKSLREKEKFWIKFYDARNPEIGYNILEGGEGFGSGKEHPFYRKVGENHPSWGNHHNEKTKQLLRISREGTKHSEETLMKMRLARVGCTPMKGKKHSDETKKEMSLHRQGKDNNFYGKTHTETTKTKIRLARTGKPRSDEIRLQIGITMKEYWRKRKGGLLNDSSLY